MASGHLALRLSLLALFLLHLEMVAAPPREWPFRQPIAREAPSVHAADRVRNPIDAFVIEKLEEQELSLAPEASPRSLVRRLYYDLIGLPPSPDEVEAFVNEPNYERLVDKLLDDPRYGERWARFWLDLARYADTAGYEGDPDLPHAWRYRDYVIDSLNRDKPYDLFIKEQIAGDEFAEIMGAGELPLPDAEKVVAMTFLRLAPFTEPRGDETRHEMLSEMTSTVSSVFLGLTVGCAKCHDHKYDGIPLKDFYRLKAFFNTVQIMPPERGDAFQIGGPLPADFYRKGEKDWAAKKRAEISAIPSKLEKMREAFSKRSQVPSGAGIGLQSMASGNDYFYDTRPIDDGALHSVVISSDGEHWTFSTDGHFASSLGSLSGKNHGDWFGDLANPTHITLGQHTNGSGNPQGSGHQGKIAQILIYEHPLNESERQLLKSFVSNDSAPPSRGLRFWLDASDLQEDPGSLVAAWRDKIGGIILTQPEKEKQPRLVEVDGKRALAFDKDFLAAAADRSSFLKDQTGSIVMVLSVEHEGEGYGFEVGGNGAFVSTVVYPKAGNQERALDDWINDPSNTAISTEERRRYQNLQSRNRFAKQHLKRLQPQAMSLRHSFGPPYEPSVPVTHVMLRGEFNNPGEEVKAGFLSCITGHQKPAEIRLDPFKRWPTRSRRMTLAKWIASPDNPLTARVMMNRLWFRHFGRGIVATPSDFGKLSGGPSHEALLDWLAVRFIRENWSLKAMHRLMVTSSTYRQRSDIVNPSAALADPNNTLLWKFNRRRLEAEAVRDAVLTTSGRLNPEMFGLPIFPPLPDGIEERVKYSHSKWATDTGPGSRKRSLYIYQQRTLSMPFMQAFDGLVCEDTMPRRQTSVTPLQALAMYNGDFVNEEARHFAQRLCQEAGKDPEERIERAFAIAYGRFPTPEEKHDLIPFATSDEKLPGLCRILLNANEFVYVD